MISAAAALASLDALEPNYSERDLDAVKTPGCSVSPPEPMGKQGDDSSSSSDVSQVSMNWDNIDRLNPDERVSLEEVRS